MGETLNHMSLPDAQNALRRFQATGARYLLTNVHEGAPNEEGNAKTCYTTYVHYDYTLPPFNLRRIAPVIEYQGPKTSFSLSSFPGHEPEGGGQSSSRNWSMETGCVSLLLGRGESVVGSSWLRCPVSLALGMVHVGLGRT